MRVLRDGVREGEPWEGGVTEGAVNGKTCQKAS